MADRDTPQVDLPVLAIGEILIDLIVSDGSPTLEHAGAFVARAGGAPANAAVALARLGQASAFCGVVGADPFGGRLLAELRGEGVDARWLRQSPLAATTVAYAWKNAKGDGEFWLVRGADTLLSAEDTVAAIAAGVSAVIVGSVSLSNEGSRVAIERAVSEAAIRSVPVVFDVNFRPSVWRTVEDARSACEAIALASRVVKLSLDDACGLFQEGITPEDAVQRTLALGPAAVVLTDGARGCWFANAEEPLIEHQPAYVVDAIEPTGAGDAFTAALVASMVRSAWSPVHREQVSAAAAAGAIATTKPGAWAALPTTAQLEAFLESR